MNNSPKEALNPNEFVCPSCGKPVNPANKMCIRCGTELNITASENVEINSYSLMDIADDAIDTSFLPATIVNLILFLLTNIIIDSLVLADPWGHDPILKVITITGIITGILFLYIVSYQKLLVKASLPWWGIYIPGYRIVLISKMISNSYTYLLKFLIPIVIIVIIGAIAGGYQFDVALGIVNYLSLLFRIFITIKFCNRFQIHFVKIFLLSPIYIPIVAFSRRYTCK